MNDSRRFDLVLFGATGFTGGLTAAYLAEHAPPACAGHSPAGTGEADGRPGPARPAHAELPLLHAEPPTGSLATVAADTRSWPPRWALHPVRRVVGGGVRGGGDRLPRPDRRAGVRRPMYVGTTTGDGERRPADPRCGLDSIPYDLGVQFTVEQFRPVSVAGERDVRIGAMPSGGTYHTFVTPFQPLPQAGGRRRSGAARAAAERPQARAVAGKPHRVPGRATGRCRCRRSTRRSSPARPAAAGVRAGLHLLPLRRAERHRRTRRGAAGSAR